MTHDIFFAIGQNEVEGQMPTEQTVWRNFFSQVELADQLGFGCAWVAETHLSTEVQKRNPGAVVPSFKGEIGLNTDILQLAPRVFSRTSKIAVGSAIRNILCNGGPMAHAEAVRTFLSLEDAIKSDRRLELGFASGRFPYSNMPYGIRPRNGFEAVAWPVLKGLIFAEAVEIFLRFVRGDIFSSRDVRPKILTRALFRNDEEWSKTVKAYRSHMTATNSVLTGSVEAIEVESWWTFDDVGVIPFEVDLSRLALTIGAHEASVQALANEFLPVGVFNLSITPAHVIEETHARMAKFYNARGGTWRRALMPRTVMVFPDRNRERARAKARSVLEAYWRAMEGTVDPAKVLAAEGNALVGEPREIVETMRERYHRDDRLMLWFDFNNYDNDDVRAAMRLYSDEIAPHL